MNDPATLCTRVDVIVRLTEKLTAAEARHAALAEAAREAVDVWYGRKGVAFQSMGEAIDALALALAAHDAAK